jgi:predicted transcriptional regulator
MKSATFPPLRTTPELRQAAEKILGEGETLSSFVEQAIRESVARRKHQQEFIARGLRSRDEARENGKYVTADSVIEKLEHMLTNAKAQR